MTDNYTQAFNAVVNLERERRLLEAQINKLVAGAARQAKTIREQGERISQLEAETTTKDYDIELLKGQGRKTRAKVRGLKKALSDSRNHLGQALTRAEQAEVGRRFSEFDLFMLGGF